MPVLNNARDQAVQAMFDRIAKRYDLLNRVISFRLDERWRNQAIRSVLTRSDPFILDLGAGTGDLTFAAARAMRGSGRIIGMDFSVQMLQLAQQKKSRARYGERTVFVAGSALSSPFRNEVFDGVITAFVLRNVSDLGVFFAHAFRVLKPGGRFVSLDMFPPAESWFAKLYGLYFYRIVPWIGGMLAQDRGAYKYLSQSVQNFHRPEKVADLIEKAGFRDVQVKKFLRGAVCLHVAQKSGQAP